MPIIRRTYSIDATLVFVTVYGWLSGLLVGIHSNQQTGQLMMGIWMPETCTEEKYIYSDTSDNEDNSFRNHIH